MDRGTLVLQLSFPSRCNYFFSVTVLLMKLKKSILQVRKRKRVKSICWSRFLLRSMAILPVVCLHSVQDDEVVQKKRLGTYALDVDVQPSAEEKISSPSET